MELSELKQAYATVAAKHTLPSFEELNENFEIEKIERDTDYLLREIRKVMMEKTISYIRFIEMMINPAQAPPMFMVFVKDISVADKEKINSIYKDFVELELEALKLEIMYSEHAEVAIISKILEVWNKNKESLVSVVDMMERNWNSAGMKKEKAYFG